MSTITEEDAAGTGFVPIVVHLPPVLTLSDEQLFDLCQANRELRIERNAHGELIFMPPAGGESSNRNLSISGQLWQWSNRDGTGKAFDSSAGFRLPNGAMRSPDASWLRLSRWNALTAEQRKKFVPLCPDFVLELRSPSDRLRTLQDKMEEYIENGAEMGLLVDPEQKRVYCYRRGQDVQILEAPPIVSCEPVLPGFTLDLSEFW